MVRISLLDIMLGLVALLVCHEDLLLFFSPYLAKDMQEIIPDS